ncbi:hypothetical protein H4R18_004640 [Coemansia javaensis]|uniref:B-block binding subunit of TFIIIC domain-containing protein n=1 Tax=Coemansia javaensis TaxID=2761396 RepID=A0A9W8H8U7_9FUNG|nr:hypothetical protein H4R18_004640 [Coemansia javaensis]
MDDVLQIIKREITLDCEEGSTLGQVWGYVDLAQRELCQRRGVGADAAGAADSALRDYLWPHIVQLRDLMFLSKGATVRDNTDPAGAGSAEAKRLQRLGAAEAEKRYPDLVVRASLPAIYRELFGREEGNERVVSSANARKFLMALSRARGKGITQARLSKDFGIDPRSTFHYINVLDKFGLVVKHATFDEGNNTKLVVLRRFSACEPAATDDPPGRAAVGLDSAATAAGAPGQGSDDTSLFVRSQMRQRVSDILEKSACGYMVESDIIDALGLDIWKTSHRKYFHRVMRYLNAQGYAESVRMLLPDSSSQGAGPTEADDDAAQDDAEAQDQPGATSTKGRKKAKRPGKVPDGYSYRRCVRFIKPYVEDRKLRTSQGIPLRTKEAMLNIRTQADADGSGAEGENDDLDDAPRSSDDDEDSDGDEGGNERGSGTGKDDIKYMLSKPQVQAGMLVALPVEMQILRIVALSGRQGIITMSIQYLLGIEYIRTSRALARLETTPVFAADGSIPGLVTSEEDKARNRQHLNEMLLIVVDEIVGREHRKRYFANPLARPITDRLTIDYTSGGDADGGGGAVPAPAPAPAPVSGMRDAGGDVSSSSDSGDETGAVHREPAAQILFDSMGAQYGDMASGCGDIEELLEEAKARKVRFGTVIRERVVLQMLARESIFSVSRRTALVCGETCRVYLERHKDSAVLTAAIVGSAQSHALDKRTLLRTVEGLADQGRIWYQTVPLAPGEKQSRGPKCRRIAIVRSADPTGPLIKAFIDQQRDTQTFGFQPGTMAPRSIAEPIEIPRTEGAAERDREFNERVAETVRVRCKRGRASRMDGGADKVSHALIKRARVMLDGVKGAGAASHAGADAEADMDMGWKRILQHLYYTPSRIGRMVDLLTHLVKNLPGQADSDDHVYRNCAFRTSYLFHSLPLGLFVELCGGARYMPMVIPYIRYGEAVLDADSDTDMGGEPAAQPRQPTLDEITGRLAAPVGSVPPKLRARLHGLGRARRRMYFLLQALQALQLIRPVYRTQDAVAMPEPPDAKDAFKRVLVGCPTTMLLGYQLVGKARLLARDGYQLAMDAFAHSTPVAADHTGHYLNDTAYDLFAPLGLVSYLRDLELSARELCQDLPRNHPLHEIDKPTSWRRSVLLTAAQSEALDEAFEGMLETPLADVQRLREAAALAGTTLDEAEHYYQNALSRARARAGKRAKGAKQPRAARRIVERAREHEARLLARGWGAGDGSGALGRRRRELWTKKESELLTMCYVVVRHHSDMYRHPFHLRGIVDLFPRRGHTARPSEAICQHWTWIRQSNEYQAMARDMRRVWDHAFRDAVASGALVDAPTLHEFDVKAAVLYFAELLERTPLAELLEQCETATDARVRGMPGRFSKYAPRAGPLQAPGRKYEAAVRRLPATMAGCGGRYVIGSAHPKHQAPGHVEFGEDSYRDAMLGARRRGRVHAEMLTVHSGMRSAADYSCPVTTVLAGLDADGRQETVVRAADAPHHPDNMAGARPLERTVDAAALAARLGELSIAPAAAGQPSADAPADTCCDRRGDARAAEYAQAAALQAGIVNLTLTPEDEYSVSAGEALFGRRHEAAGREFGVLSRNMVVTRLRGMASSVGLSAVPRAGRGGHETVAVHETTGTTRVRTQAGTAGQNASAADAMDVDAENDVGPEGAPREEARRVPGRGFAPSDRFLGAITTPLPDGFLGADCTGLGTRPLLARRLGPAEFGYLCWLVGQGRLWLRPQYDAEQFSRLDSTSGFRRMERADVIECGVGAIASGLGDADADADADGSEPGADGPDNAGLTKELLETALRLVAEAVRMLGPLGASVYELARIFARLSGGGKTRAVLSRVPRPVLDALAADGRVAVLLKMLARRRIVHAVGSSDVRYVSAPAYQRHWVLSAGTELAPRLGLNLSGTTNAAFVLGMLGTLLGRIVDDPGISQATLMRRHFAPYIPRFELLCYLDALAAVGLIRAETVDELRPAPHDRGTPYPPQCTYYYAAPGYQRHVGRIARCSTLPCF